MVRQEVPGVAATRAGCTRGAESGEAVGSVFSCVNMKKHCRQLEVRALLKAATLYKSTTVVDVDGFHQKVRMDISDECCK